MVRFSIFLLLCPWLARAADKVQFNREIRPILAEHCFACHGPDEKKRDSGLRLDLREDALAERDGIRAIVPGQPGKSEVMLRLLTTDKEDVMPPPKEKNPLTPAQVALVKRWIAEGAEYARHWAFEPPLKVTVPPDQHPVDALVTAKLQALQLHPSPPADAATLCRRLHLDLIGLPPAPGDVATFEQNPDPPAAVKALLDRLLASPRFGEKWARHWLDAARYADSNGFEKDLPREPFNQDMPYDRFVVEQLAGDLLPNPSQEQIVATGFLRNSMVNEEGAIVPEQFRMDEMFDRMDCLGKAVLGLSIQCAQCHSHKFDPISQAEYFGIFAFFNDTYEAQSWVYTPEQRKQIETITKAVRGAGERWKKARPNWLTEMEAWITAVQAKEVAWTPLKAEEMGSTSGLNHPTQEQDLSILTLGHPTTKGDIYATLQGDWKGATGLRLEALTHGDLPFTGPGRSNLGTWAVSEMVATYQLPATTKWEPLKLVNATADFSETDDRLEDEWKASFDKKQKRVRGPVAYMIDGNDDTAWRSDRGTALRDQESVAVVQFEKPLDLPEGTKMKVLLRFHHSGDDNGRHNTMLGRLRLSTTTAPAPVTQAVDYAAILAMGVPPAQRTPAQNDALFAAWRQSVAEAKAINEEIAAEWKKYPMAGTSLLHLAARPAGDERVTHLLDRGAWEKPKQAIAPHVPAALHPLDAAGQPDRLAFARWVADRRSPLTARVAVNRVWQAIFGSGLLETSEDFGTRAPVPEQGELLDWLAVDFMEHGWSHKHLIRTILTSATYQQSSKATPALLERDPRNRLLTRGPRLRMEAEVIRDNALAIAGLLDSKVGGPSIFPPVPKSVLDYNFSPVPYWQPPTGSERYRRALYVFRKRSMPDPMLSSFDAPNADAACARRPRSNTPLSALAGWNETTFVEAAQALAQRVLREGGSDDAARVRYAYRLCTAREIKPAELATITKLLEQTRARLKKGELKATEIAFSELTKADQLPADATPNDIALWTVIGRTLLNLDETLTKG